MRKRTIAAVAVSALAAAFVVVNWRAFAEPVALNFVVARLELPIGFVLLGIGVSIAAIFGVFAGIWQTSFLREYRRQTRELETQRKLADSAEASRFTELGNLIRSELSTLDQRLQDSLRVLGTELRDTEHSIAATLGEMDDRIRRMATGAVSRIGDINGV